ncbi:ChbG/HpnK family deacetylase [Thalassobaculum sp.]|uniref:ChbG/HpnK family deacetylase n=1 Tax=Thalassobaculum sp. TaxID=2022740 RepID=UPI0032ECFFF3
MSTYQRLQKPVILCADDYGIAPGVSRGIRALAAAGRLSATSCMALFPEWPAEAGKLGDLVDRIDVGLHLTLTDHPPLGAMPKLAPGGRLPPLGRLIRDTHLGRLDRAEISGEIGRQLDAFEAALGRPPAFIDGHQHVHLLPGVRDGVLALFDHRLDRRTTWLRSCFEPTATILRRRRDAARALVIAQLGRPLARVTAEAGIATNVGFSGVTSFRSNRAVDHDFAGYLDHTGSRPLVMCHPGEVDDLLAARDPVLASREAELAYLRSDLFAERMARHHMVLARGPHPDDRNAMPS